MFKRFIYFHSMYMSGLPALIYVQYMHDWCMQRSGHQLEAGGGLHEDIENKIWLPSKATSALNSVSCFSSPIFTITFFFVSV